MNIHSYLYNIYLLCFFCMWPIDVYQEATTKTVNKQGIGFFSCQSSRVQFLTTAKSQELIPGLIWSRFHRSLWLPRLPGVASQPMVNTSKIDSLLGIIQNHIPIILPCGLTGVLRPENNENYDDCGRLDPLSLDVALPANSNRGVLVSTTSSVVFFSKEKEHACTNSTSTSIHFHTAIGYVTYKSYK